MPAVQTSYVATMPIGFVGEIADLGLANVLSREAENGVGFGLAVIQGTADHGCKVGGDGSFLGISVRDVTLDSRRSDAYAQYDTVAVLDKGSIWVSPLVAVVPGDPVYRTPAGAITNVVGTRTASSAAKSGGNTGTGTMGAITVTGAVPDGVYALRITALGSNAGRFTITDDKGRVIGVGDVATAYSQDGLAFTLADGTPDFAIGDGFDITVTGGNVLIPNARFETTGSTTVLAKVRLS